MNRRAYERVNINFRAKFFYGNTLYTGEITNLSENGIYISTRLCFPFESRFEILIPLDEGVLKVPVKVSRIIKTDDFYEGMGLELLEQSKNYLEFVRNLRSIASRNLEYPSIQGSVLDSL